MNYMHVIVCAVPVAFFISAMLAQRISLNQAWYIAKGVSVALFLLSVVALALPSSSSINSVIMQSNLSEIMLVLISFIAMVVLKFSHRYFEGEPKQQHYLTWVQLTLAAVTTVVISDHIVMFWLAWVAISLCFHQLLMFYPHRPRAVLAAHKKFIFARLSEGLLFIAFALLYIELNTLSITQILAHFTATDHLSISAQIAALLIGLVAFIKCAQLPLHGWLIQVVETPTPISALLHGGIINLGGFLLILFAPLFIQAAFAQWTLIILASVSTLLSALIMMTRVSIKVRLAWSTSAQMGLMLIECALGLYELAILHLLAHSFYKAFAFLHANSEVERHLRGALGHSYQPSLTQYIVSFIIALVLVTIGFNIYHVFDESTVYSPWLLLALALSLWLVQSLHGTFTSRIKAVLISLMIIASYGGAKLLMAQLVPPMIASQLPHTDLFVCFAIGVCFLSYLAITHKHDSVLAKKIQSSLFGGLYLDEWATKVTLHVWPTNLPKHHLTRPMEQ
jgi:NAD(P)H-quinone oxidoreductase subunit 5